MNEKNAENPLIEQAIAPQSRKELVEYTSVFTKNLPQKTHNAVICMFISVGKDHCSGGQLRSALKLLNKTFAQSHVLFVIADSLQRFTHQLHGMSPEEAEKKAIEEGLGWKNDHVPMIEKELTRLTYYFIHWSELTSQNERYPNCEKQIDDAYQTDSVFKRKFNKTITGFLSAQLGDDDVAYVADHETGAKLCLAYIREETSAHLVLANPPTVEVKALSFETFNQLKERKIDYAVYPRSISDAFEATYKKFIQPEVLTYLPIKNKLVKPLPLLHKKPEVPAANQSAFFKPVNNTSSAAHLTKSVPIDVKPTLAVPENTSFSLGYFSCLKTILNSNAIGSDSKLQLMKEIIAEGEKALLTQQYPTSESPPRLG